MLIHDVADLKSTSPVPWVLLVADPTKLPAGLCGAICMAGYALVVRGDASSGLEAAHEEPPGIILCDVELPDGDGYSFTRWVRSNDGFAATPVVLLADDASLGWRLRGFQAGADACLGKRRAILDIVGQVSAFVRMAARLRRRRAELDAKPRRLHAIHGDVSQIAVTTMLSVLDMERRSGVFEVSGGRSVARIHMVRGYAVLGSADGSRVSPLAAIESMISIRAGRFSFRPRSMRAMAPLVSQHPPALLRELLAEAQRLRDEGATALGARATVAA